jgi:hypothetical protein
MDPLSIVGTAVSLTVAIGRVAHEVDQFMRQVREARRELNDISRELGSLKSAIELLSEDLKTPGVVVPGSLADILQECQDSITRLEETIKKYAQDKLTKRIGYVWSGKETIMMHKGTLSAHRAALDLAVDVITLSLSREIKAGVDETLENTHEIKMGVDETKANTDRILEQIAALQARLPEALQAQSQILGSHSTFMLQKYLEELTEYAETVAGGDELVTNDSSSRVSMDRTKPGVSSSAASTHSWRGDTRVLHDAVEDIMIEEKSLSSDVTQDSRLFRVAGTRSSSMTPDPTPSDQELEQVASQSPGNAISNTETASVEIKADHRRHGLVLRRRSEEQLHPVPDAQSSTTSTPAAREARQVVNTARRPSTLPTKSKLLNTVAKDFDILSRREVSGLESLEWRDWRRTQQEAMQRIPREHVAPVNGESYERGIDYKVDTSVDSPWSPRISPIGLAAIGATDNVPFSYSWIRAVTMQDPSSCSNVSVSIGGVTEIIVPLALALTLRDWIWLDRLLDADEQSGGARAWTYWRSRDGVSILDLALNWNIRLAEAILEWWFDLDAKSANEARYAAILYIMQEVDDDERITPVQANAVADLRLHAFKNFLMDWPIYLLDKRLKLIRKAITRSDTRMVDILLQFARQVKFGDMDIVEALHEAIVQENWHMVRHLAEQGANVEHFNIFFLSDGASKDQSAVDLATRRDCLTALSEAVGYDFEKGIKPGVNKVSGARRTDKKPLLSKFSMLFNRRVT